MSEERQLLRRIANRADEFMVSHPVDGERDILLLDIIFGVRDHHSIVACLQTLLQFRQRVRRDGRSGPVDGVIYELGARGCVVVVRNNDRMTEELLVGELVESESRSIRESKCYFSVGQACQTGPILPAEKTDVLAHVDFIFVLGHRGVIIIRFRWQLIEVEDIGGIFKVVRAG